MSHEERKPTLRLTAFAVVLLGMAVLAGACGSDNNGQVTTPLPAPAPTGFINYGVAVVGNDGNGYQNGLQVMKIEDSNGNALPTPLSAFFKLANAGDIDGLSITPDGSHGAVIDGGNTVYFFSGDLSTGTFTVSPKTVDVSNFGGDGDAIASLPGGDEVVVSGDSITKLALISGVASDNPVLADSIKTSGTSIYGYDGVVISNDGKVMLARGPDEVGSTIDVYSITPVTPHPGSIGGTVSFKFTLKTTLTGLPDEPNQDGRDGMAISPTDSSRAIVIGSGGEVDLITGLHTNSPTVTKELTLTNPPNAVVITPDGKYGIVSSSVDGLLVLAGINTGPVTQQGVPYTPTFSVPGGNCTLNDPQTSNVMADGKYVVTIQVCDISNLKPHLGNGVLLTVPISNGVLGSPAGKLNYVVTPDDDQLVVH